jgi:hypothetical protein
MVRTNWYYNIDNDTTAINVSSIVRFYPEIRKIGIFLTFYRDDQFINAECWIDENSKSPEKLCVKKETSFLDDENLEKHMVDWLDKQVKAKDNLNFCSKSSSIGRIEKSYPVLFRAIQKFVYNEVFS